MSALERAVAEAEVQAERDAVGRGHILVWAAILPYALLEVIILAVDLSSGSGMRVGTTAVRGVLEVGVLWMTLNGGRGARRWLAFFSALGFVAGVAIVVGLTTRSASLFTAGFVAMCAFAFWVFVFSADAKVYLDGRAVKP